MQKKTENTLKSKPETQNMNYAEMVVITMQDRTKEISEALLIDMDYLLHQIGQEERIQNTADT